VSRSLQTKVWYTDVQNTVTVCISLDFPPASMPRPAEDNPASYPMGTWGPFPQVKSGRGVTLTTQPHLVPTSRMSRIYSSSPPQRLHGGSGTALFYTSTDRTNGTQRNTTTKNRHKTWILGQLPSVKGGSLDHGAIWVLL
jgi:hypothetical protein